MTTVTDARRVQPVGETETPHDAPADRDEAVDRSAELVWLLAQAYLRAPLFA